MKSIDVTASKYIHFDVKNNDKGPKVKFRDQTITLKHIFCKRLHTKLIRKSFCY